ncbi:MAG: toll/interleukin-1 receptor domain-containing protein [Bacteroidaceae bacterium]|nr:toll/interleukin-1 receptor domain-containing protein [Bacteroidaceae bacterium]
MDQKFDIFISYKRKSLNTAYLLYSKLGEKGYSVFLDIEELGPGKFDEQIYRFIDNASDIIVLIEQGSLDGWSVFNADGERTEEYKKDWFYKEVSYAFKLGKNIVPIWNNCPVANGKILPTDVATIVDLESKPFMLHYVNAYIDELVTKNFIKSSPNKEIGSCSIFKLYSDRNCEIYNGKTLIGKVLSYAEEPLYWYITRKGDYRIKCVADNGKVIILNSTIAENEERIIDIKYKRKKLDFKYIYSFMLSLMLLLNVFFILYWHDGRGESVFTSKTKYLNHYFNAKTDSVSNHNAIVVRTPEIEIENLKSANIELGDNEFYNQFKKD